MMTKISLFDGATLADLFPQSADWEVFAEMVKSFVPRLDVQVVGINNGAVYVEDYRFNRGAVLAAFRR
jgi:hypothetical protein